MQLFDMMNVSLRNTSSHRLHSVRARRQRLTVQPVSSPLTREQLQAIVMEMVD